MKHNAALYSAPIPRTWSPPVHDSDKHHFPDTDATSDGNPYRTSGAR